MAIGIECLENLGDCLVKYDCEDALPPTRKQKADYDAFAYRLTMLLYDKEVWICSLVIYFEG